MDNHDTPPPPPSTTTTVQLEPAPITAVWQPLPPPPSAQDPPIPTTVTTNVNILSPAPRTRTPAPPIPLVPTPVPLPPLSHVVEHAQAMAPPPLPPTQHTPAPGPSTPTVAPATQAVTSPESPRPLNVTDALSYLDAVKVRFAEKPDVYNHFLDIMKDFKSQVIDTPGVIERVSTLFNGHPTLIQGFNTFLPPGYRIECSMDPHDNNIIVTTPSGTTTQSTNSLLTRPLGVQASHPSHLPPGAGSTPSPAPNLDGRPSSGAGLQYNTLPPPPTQQGSSFTSGLPNPPLGNTRPVTPLVSSFQQPPSLSSQSGQQTGSTHQHSPALPSALGGPPLQRQVPPPSGLGPIPLDPTATGAVVVTPGGTSGPGAEFNHAIQYVNKIKTRFAHDPDTYKQFLEILQTFQKDQREYHDVHSEVLVLFKNAPDLLEEFKQFLPDAGGVQSSGGLFAVTAAAGRAGDTWDKGDKDKRKKDTAPAQPVRRKRRALDKEAPVVKPGGNKKAKHHHSKADPPSPSAYHQDPSPPHHAQTAHASHQAYAMQPHVLTTADELAFFDRLKKSFEVRETYDEFLKLLNLFAKDVIDMRTLVDKAIPFLGGNDSDLMAQFKEILGWDERMERMEVEPPPLTGTRSSIAVMIKPQRGDPNHRSGPSYRRLPPSEAQIACSGRDEMCRSVLNDEWVSHPQWASEEGGFVAHKKNAYEEALAKSEEERHEYDFHIEAIMRTISILDPINMKIAQMTADERAMFKLKPGFGGSSKTIPQRIIKKVYGREVGMEVIQALQECPAVAVPVVLTRLKQKDEEWRRAQREWNKVWREVDARNFYKSLDHQGITFKATDKKTITSKFLVSEIETKREELRSVRKALIDPTFARTQSKYHLSFTINDFGVTQDAVKLILSFLDRTQGQFSNAERGRIEKFLRDFIPLFFMLRQAEFEAALDGEPGVNGGASIAPRRLSGESEQPQSDGMDIDSEGDDAGSSRGGRNGSGKRSANGSGGANTNGVHPGDLRKKLLKSAQVNKRRDANSGATTAATIPALAGAGAGTGSAPTSAQVSRPGSPAAPHSSTGPGADAMQVDQFADVPVLLSDTRSTLPVDGQWIHLAPGPPVVQEPATATAPVAVTDGDGDVDMAADKHPPSPKNPVTRKGIFFANTTFYVLLRLLQLLYQRLALCKDIATRLGEDPKTPYLANPLAVELGLTDATGVGGAIPTTANAQTTSNGASAEDGQDASNPPDVNPAVHFYVHLLDSCEKLFDGDLDQAAFEENMRFMFGTKAYQLFTLDKVIGAIIKQAQSALTDSRSQELLTQLRKERATESPSVQQIVMYRRQAEDLIGPDENLFRIIWDKTTMAVQLLGKEDNSIDDTDTLTERWKLYMESFVLPHPTEGVQRTPKNPFLQRTLHALDVPAKDEFITHTGLGIKVCLRTYRLFFVSHTEDFLWRKKYGSGNIKSGPMGVADADASRKDREAKAEARRASNLERWLKLKEEERQRDHAVDVVS